MLGRAPIYAALVRTHHITSRKKVAKLRQAAANHEVAVLIRSGGSPGMMYVEGRHEEVQNWIEVVQRLRYKDYHLAARPTLLSSLSSNACDDQSFTVGKLAEVEAVKDFAQLMAQRGIAAWWRAAMGYPDRSSDS